MSYLARLRRQISGNRVLTSLTKLTEAPFVSSVSSEDRAFPEIGGAEWEERAALVEYDGGTTRQLAEVFAQFEIYPSPPGIEPERWHRAQEVFAGLLASGVAVEALGLGWDARELVGVERTQPHDAPSRAGLVFSMRPGDSVPDVHHSGCIASTDLGLKLRSRAIALSISIRRETRSCGTETPARVATLSTLCYACSCCRPIGRTGLLT